ncbi:MAG TPA: oxidoreductase [Planococcus sp. (in: firmicutes)]|nr:oxidoreductase [Planococcus sp. (in: firmicutes)]
MNQNRLDGKTVIITGGNSGIGLEAAKALAQKGATIILAVRNEEKGNLAWNQIMEEIPSARVKIMKLDLADLESVRSFAEAFERSGQPLDLLINNAGLMAPPYATTKDGFEMQFGSNHLGHFALTGRLLPQLIKTPGSRVVTVSSLAHRRAAIGFDNLDGAKGYNPRAFYAQSKLANLLFAQELDKRLKAHGLQTISVSCHPGISATNIFKFGKRDAPPFLLKFANLFLQSPALGGLATVYAATEPSLKGGEYIGPDGKGRRKGKPAIDTPHAVAGDDDVSKRLWTVSEELTGVTFDFSR